MASVRKFVAPGDGPVLNVLGGDEVTLKVVGAETSGAYAVLETRTPPGGGPPLHVHHREDEAFYVLEGEFEFRLGAETIRATAGAFLVGPRDIPHAFRNVGATWGKMLVYCTPAGFENFLAELSDATSIDPPDTARVGAVFQAYGLEFVV